ncbi:MAG: hypothetical protein RI942_1167, partial [Pseudomonadota bacterium]
MMNAYGHLQKRIRHLLGQIYRDSLLPVDEAHWAEVLLNEMRLDEVTTAQLSHKNVWSQADAWVITYGDSILSEGEKPLATLKRFTDEHLKTVINGVHILPFYPYSSDDGFAVLDYSSVNETL